MGGYFLRDLLTVCLTDEVEVVQIYTLRKIVVQLIDSLTANPCDTSKVALCHPPFAKAG